MAATPITVGSPQQVIDKVMTFQEGFGDYQRQLFAVDGLSLPVEVALEQVELLGTEVVPVLRKEMEARRAAGRTGRPDARLAGHRQVRRRRAAPAAAEPQPRRQPLRHLALPGQRPRRRGPLPAGARDGRRIKLANEAWEAMFRAQSTLALEFEREGDWGDLLPREYGVLYALSQRPNGLRMTELCDDVLLTQAGISRLVSRLEKRDLVERSGDPADARAYRIRLTAAGARGTTAASAAHTPARWPRR